MSIYWRLLEFLDSLIVAAVGLILCIAICIQYLVWLSAVLFYNVFSLYRAFCIAKFPLFL